MQARYLVEDNADEKLDYDPNSTCKVSVVKSILRSFLGAYELLDDEQTQKITEQIRQVGQKHNFRQFKRPLVDFKTHLLL